MAERIVFDRSLYVPEAVAAAAAAYAEHAEIDVAPQSDATVAVIGRIVGDHDPELVARAFCNHVLHETIARRRQADPES